MKYIFYLFFLSFSHLLFADKHDVYHKHDVSLHTKKKELKTYHHICDYQKNKCYPVRIYTITIKEESDTKEHLCVK